MTRAQGQLSGKTGKLSSAHIRKQQVRNTLTLTSFPNRGSKHIKEVASQKKVPQDQAGSEGLIENQKAVSQKSIHFLKRRKKVQRISGSRRPETTTYHGYRRNRLARSKHIKKRESRSIIDC